MSNKNKQIAKISVFITSIFVIILSISYAFITNIITGEKQVVINAGVLDLVLEEENNVTLTNAYPMYDEVGMIQEDSFDFKLVNKTKNDVNYTLYLEDVTPEYITGKCSDLGEITTSSPKECRKNNYPDDLREAVLNNTFFDEGMTEEEALSFWKENIATTDYYIFQYIETFEDIIDFVIDDEKIIAEDTRTLIETYPENNYKIYTLWFHHSSELKYYLTKDGVGEVKCFPNNYKDDIYLEDVELDYGLIKGNQSIDYSLRLWINSEVDDYFTKERIFSYKLKVEVNQKKEGLALRQVLDLENKVDTTTEIDFSKVSSETNGRGIYKYTEDGEDIYYWRGAVTDNHIIFGGYCWEMIRTTKTGGVKMIYDGVPVGGKCANTGSDSTIGESEFYFWGYNSDVGYMLGLGEIKINTFVAQCIKLNSSNGDPETGNEQTKEDCIKAGGKWATSPYEATHANVANSKVKTYIDEWFSSSSLNSDVNLEKIEDAVYCNDRSLSINSIYAGVGTSQNAYGGENRLSEGCPSLECPNLNDRFTVNSENGNRELTYPVGLITMDEAMLAGGTGSSSIYDYNYDYYLYTGEFYLTMTPSFFYYNVGGTYMGTVGAKGDLGGEAISSGIRPVISLKSSVKVIDGDGTEDNPYIVK